VWSSRNGLRWPQLSDQSNPLFEFRLPLESYTTNPSQPAAANRLLSWAFAPYSTSRIEGPLLAGLPARFVPPSGFDYPLGGFLPSIPCQFSFTPAALLGFALRSFLLPNGSRPYYPPSRPAYRFAHRCSRRRSSGPAQQAAVPGLSPVQESLASDSGLANRPLVAPLGFALLGSSHKGLGQTFARPPLTRFARPTITRRTRRRPRVSIGPRFNPSQFRAETQIRIGQPF